MAIKIESKEYDWTKRMIECLEQAVEKYKAEGNYLWQRKSEWKLQWLKEKLYGEQKEEW